MTQRGRAGARPAAGSRPVARPGGQSSRRDLAARRERLRAVIEPVVVNAGYDLENVSVSRVGRRHIVRVIIDADGGVTLDNVAEVSQAISKALDAAEEREGELIAGEYQLEVSSPGVDRPLTLPRHWRRNVGRLVRVAVGERQVVGRITAADDERVTLDVNGSVQQWSYGELGPGRVQVEFDRVGEFPDEDFPDEELADIEGIGSGDEEVDEEIVDEEVEDEER
ncbi:MAG: ribosome maturation factor RimP [Actinobacteria bacterium]|nr:MAG: ribosome maturation factor RimP [Actinomycetota bacterium]